jgi:fucose permease
MAMLVLGVGGSVLSGPSDILVGCFCPDNRASRLNLGHGLFGLGAIFFLVHATLTECLSGW